MGITLTLCNVGGIVSGQISILDQAPQFRLGHAYSMGCIVLSVVGLDGVEGHLCEEGGVEGGEDS